MRHHQDPLPWKAAARRLLSSIAVMEKGCLSSSDLEESDANLIAMMLAGFAFENAFKGYLLSKGEVLYDKGKLKEEFRTHSYIKWIEDYTVALQGWECEALDKAEYFAKSWARYPAHNISDKERPFETWGWEDVRQIQNLVERLLHQTT